MTAKILIRLAQGADVPAIAAIHAESWRRHYRGMYSDLYLDGDLDADRLAAWTSKVSRDPRAHFTLIAEQGGRAIGFAHVMLDADPRWGALVDNLHVSHAAQRGGIGSRLLDAVAHRVMELRPDSGIYLWVLEQNVAATAFYLSRHGVLQDTEFAAPPNGDPRNLAGTPRRIRVSWADPSVLLLRGAGTSPV